jgi:hypothetical protein
MLAAAAAATAAAAACQSPLLLLRLLLWLLLGLLLLQPCQLSRLGTRMPLALAGAVLSPSRSAVTSACTDMPGLLLLLLFFGGRAASCLPWPDVADASRCCCCCRCERGRRSLGRSLTSLSPMYSCLLP